MGDKKKGEGTDDKKNVVTEEFLKTVGNKIRRRELGAQLKRQKKKEKRKRQDERKKVAGALGDDAPAKLVPKTLDNQREHDETTVVNKVETFELGAHIFVMLSTLKGIFLVHLRRLLSFKDGLRSSNCKKNGGLSLKLN